jgi:hypothetical protein
MCGGPTQAQENLQNEQAAFYQNQVSAYNTAYANFSQISNQLQNMYAPILAKGPSQEGFSAGETEALNAQATEGTAENYKAAGQALNERIGAQGGGTSNENITGAGADALREQLAATGASAQSAQETQIQEADYAEGHQDYEQAVGGEQSLASGWNPNAFAGSATNAGNAEETTAGAIASEQDSVWNSVFSALGGVAGAAVGNLNVGPFAG